MAATKSTGGPKKTSVKKAPARKKAAGAAAGTTTAKPKKKTGGAKTRSARTTAESKKAAGQAKGLVFELKKIMLGVVILVAVCLTGAMLADIFLKSVRPVPSTNHNTGQSIATRHNETPKPEPPMSPEPRKPAPKDPEALPLTKSRAAGLKEKPRNLGKTSIAETPVQGEGAAIVYEVYDDVTHTTPPNKPVVPPIQGKYVPRMAIIIDDIGYDKKLAMGLFNIDKNITFSILPFSPAGTALARRLSAKGAELMLHLPMEPTQYPKVNPGPGALLSAMSPDELLAQLRKDIQAIPGTVGVNNHMGSRLTADSDKMNQIFTVLKKQDLFFIDSRTSPESKGEQSARMFQLKFSHRDVFLDNFQNVEYISGQLEKLVKAAKTHGQAIGIGHPHKATLEALKRELPKTRNQVRLVPASQLTAIPSG